MTSTARRTPHARRIALAALTLTALAAGCGDAQRSSGPPAPPTAAECAKLDSLYYCNGNNMSHACRTIYDCRNRGLL